MLSVLLIWMFWFSLQHVLCCDKFEWSLLKYSSHIRWRLYIYQNTLHLPATTFRLNHLHCTLWQNWSVPYTVIDHYYILHHSLLISEDWTSSHETSVIGNLSVTSVCAILGFYVIWNVLLCSLWLILACIERSIFLLCLRSDSPSTKPIVWVRAWTSHYCHNNKGT